MRGSLRFIYSRHFEATIFTIVLLTSILIIPFQNSGVYAQTTSAAFAPDRSKSPTDIPSAPNPADKVVVTLVTEEVLGQLADGVTYTFWTFNGTVPGPFIRLREGQVVEVHIKNLANSTMVHSIDSHAILGTGGGSAYSQTAPGNESIFQFTAMRAGLFMYHCATPPIPAHIANGMYGLMLVEPKQGLPKVDREFYVAQGEFYTQGPVGQQGYQPFSYQKAFAETPEYVVFNGRVGSLTGNRTMRANVGDTIRIFFLNAGPNLDSSFHLIGGMLDRLYLEGSLLSPPLLNVQTTLVPAGGAVMVEYKAEVPETLTLVDHSLFRILRGALGTIKVQGPANATIISSIKNGTGPAPGVITMNMTTETMNMTSETNSGTQASSNSTIIMIQNFAYNPAQLTVTAGTTVTWINQDTVGHTVTEGNPDSPKSPSQRLFDSSHGTDGASVVTIPPGKSYSFTFTTPGQYDYYCIPHPFMRAHITVVPSQAGGSQSYGYGDMSNFYILLTGREVIGLSAFGVIILVALAVAFSRKQGTNLS
ncbi:MAG TPA: copper-containing nitrite reductase [Methylomirabilota bacterium]|nr:copper-containing nitrite reductase [Methylomirabilota bacterium]